MSLIFATQLTAVATAVLAAFAIVTAWYARRAFLKQSQEVAAIERQVTDQQELTRQQANLLEIQSDQLDIQRQQLVDQREASARQAEVFELQATELRESLEERKRDTEERRRAQASCIFIWDERSDSDPAVNQVQSALGVVSRRGISVHIENTSPQPIYDLTISWYKGTAPWDEPERCSILMPGKRMDVARTLPLDVPGQVDRSLFWATVLFRDAGGCCWRARAGGHLDEIKPGEDAPHSYGGVV
jgi:hypothetical protein